jgi:hypothetical protein
VSDQERGKHVKANDDDGGDDVEAHKHGGRDMDNSPKDDDDDAVEGHMLAGKDS